MFKILASIASGICALTAVTTAFRALGRSREHTGLGRKELGRMLFLYMAVTGIWFILSLVFVSPIVVQTWRSAKYMETFVWLAPFAILLLLLCLLWRHILLSRD
jgi:hypothetical protein